MRFFLALLALIHISSHADDISICDNIRPPANEFMTGINLTRSAHKILTIDRGQLERFVYEDKEIAVSIIDGGIEPDSLEFNIDRTDFTNSLKGNFPDHGTKYANLLFSNRSGIMHRGHLISMAEAYNDNFKKALDLISKEATIYMLEIHVTETLYGDAYDFPNKVLTEFIDTYKTKGAILGAAGNYYSVSAGIPRAIPKVEGLITVGNITANGLIYDSSQATLNTLLFAPGTDAEVTSTGAGGGLVRGSGTSAALPHAVAAIGNFYSALGVKKLEPKILEFIIGKTVLTPKYFPVNPITKFGILNAYKLQKLASRLRVAGYSKNPDVIYDEALYDFSSEADLLKSGAFEKLKNQSDLTCMDYRQILVDLQKAFLLRPDQETATKLGELLNNSEDGRNLAQFYFNHFLNVEQLKTSHSHYSIARTLQFYQEFNQ